MSLKRKKYEMYDTEHKAIHSTIYMCIYIHVLYIHVCINVKR